MLSEQSVEVGESGEAEEEEHDVCGEFDAFLPVVPQDSTQCQQQGVCCVGSANKSSYPLLCGAVAHHCWPVL